MFILIKPRVCHNGIAYDYVNPYVCCLHFLLIPDCWTILFTTIYSLFLLLIKNNWWLLWGKLVVKTNFPQNKCLCALILKMVQLRHSGPSYLLLLAFSIKEFCLLLVQCLLVSIKYCAKRINILVEVRWIYGVCYETGATLNLKVYS